MLKPIKQMPIRDQVYSKILRLILDGTMSPGTKVKDFELAARFAISRTPVRETLLRLERDGFLKNEMGKGFVVLPLTSEEVEEIYPVLWTLESFALASSKPISAPSLRKLDDLTQKMEIKSNNPMDCIGLDGDWHATLLSNCHNKRLLKMIESLRVMISRYEYSYMKNAELIGHSISDHKKILDLLNSGELSLATSCLKEHWKRSLNFLADRLREEKRPDRD